MMSYIQSFPMFIFYVLLFIPLTVYIGQYVKSNLNSSVIGAVFITFVILQFVPFPRLGDVPCWSPCKPILFSFGLGYPISYVRLTPYPIDFLLGGFFTIVGGALNAILSLPLILISSFVLSKVLKNQKQKIRPMPSIIPKLLILFCIVLPILLLIYGFTTGSRYIDSKSNKSEKSDLQLDFRGFGPTPFNQK